MYVSKRYIDYAYLKRLLSKHSLSDLYEVKSVIRNKVKANLIIERYTGIYAMSHASAELIATSSPVRIYKIPYFLDKRVFGLIFNIGEVAKLTPEDKMAYEASLKHQRDAENTYSTAQRLGHDRGLKEGLKEGIAQGE